MIVVEGSSKEGHGKYTTVILKILLDIPLKIELLFLLINGSH